MITPELVSFIKAQLTSGASSDAITATLISQGWDVPDIKEAMASAKASMPATPPPIASSPMASPGIANASQPAVEVSKPFPVLKVILWCIGIFFLLSIIGSVVAGYYAYKNINKFTTTVCKVFGEEDAVECAKMTGFLKFVAKNTSISTSGKSVGTLDPEAKCSFEMNGVSDMQVLIGVTDPVLCKYSKDVDMKNISKITATATGNNLSWTKTVYEVPANKLSITDSKGKITTFEKTSEGSELFDGYIGLYVTAFKLQIPLLQMCVKSTGWNTDGKWFECDKVTALGVSVSDNESENTAVNIKEDTTPGNESLAIETRSVRDGQTNIHYLKKMKNGQEITNVKFIELVGTDKMTGVSIGQIPSKAIKNYEFVDIKYE